MIKVKKRKILLLPGDVIGQQVIGEVRKIINYTSSKITVLSEKSMDLIKKYPPNIALIYSKRSAESFDEIVRKYSLAELMTQCIVMCISKKIEDFFKSKGWKKTDVFNPGEELIKIDQIKNGQNRSIYKFVY